MRYDPIKIPTEFTGNPLAGSYINAFDKKTAQRYFRWYMSIKDQRVAALEKAVRSTPGFENWRADFTPQSLFSLQPWFGKVVEKRPLSAEEKSLFMSQYRGVWAKVIKPPEWVVTDKTRSLEHDVGIYFSEILIKQNSNLSWGQILTQKRSPDLNYPVVTGFKFTFNGYGITHGISLKVLEARENNLKKLYELWDIHAKEQKLKAENQE